MPGGVDQNYEQHHQHGQPENQKPEAPRPGFERRWRGLHVETLPDFAQRGPGPGPADQHDGRPAQDVGAHEYRGGRLGHRSRGGGPGFGMFLHRVGFAGEERLIDEAIPGLEQPAVGGHQGAGREEHDVAGHQIPGGDLPGHPAPLDRHPDCHGLPEPVCGFAGPVFLDRVEGDAQQGHHDHDHRTGDIAGGGRNGARGDQQQDQRVLEPGDEEAEETVPAGLVENVRPDGREPGRGFRLGEAVGPAAQPPGQIGQRFAPERGRLVGGHAGSPMVGRGRPAP